MILEVLQLLFQIIVLKLLDVEDIQVMTVGLTETVDGVIMNALVVKNVLTSLINYILFAYMN